MMLSNKGYEIAKARYMWPNENSWEEVALRVAREVSRDEKDPKRQNEFFEIINSGDFIPAGRILRNVGKLKPSTSNCNLLPVDDNIESIGETLKNYLIISSYGGGTGINFSSLRPKGAALKTKGGESSGVVSFIEMFNDAGMRLETGGARRAAGIALLEVSHPDVVEFINAKVEHHRINQFNISVIINEQFLTAVEQDEMWELKFSGKVFSTVKAVDLWNLILSNMIKHSEPGLINWDRMIKNNTYYFDPVIGTNPCGEIPLGAFGVCNLASINLVNFVTNKNTNWQKLSQVIKTAVRFLDNVIDISFYPIPQQESIVKNARRIGLGVMGLGDFLFKKELRYGSEKSLLEIEKLFRFIRDETYLASVELAKEKGAFPKYNKLCYSNAAFVRKLPAKLRLAIKENGVRNSTMITCPPTGSTSLLPEVSSGIEPIMRLAYRRRDGVGERIYIHPIYKKIVKENSDKPEWLVDCMDLSPEDHLEVQSVITRLVDNSVSKTINLPKDSTQESLSKLLLEYIRDLKGVTVYCDGSREDQPITDIPYKDVVQFLDQNSEMEVASCARGVCEL